MRNEGDQMLSSHYLKIPFLVEMLKTFDSFLLFCLAYSMEEISRKYTT